MRRLIKPLVRNLALPLAYKVGFDNVLRNTSGNPYLILCYHGVDVDSSLPYTGRHISASVFERHLKYFQRHFSVVSLRQIFKMSKGGVQPEKPTIAITFDDGYANNFEVALPLLKKYNMPASFYISGICVEKPDYVIWADIIDVIRVHRGEAGIQHGGFSFLPVGSALWDEAHGLNIYDYIKNLPIGKRDEVLMELRQQYHFDQLVRRNDIQYFKLMDRQQIQACADSGLIEIGVHGYEHYNLAYMPVDDARKRVQTAKNLLEDCSQQKVLSIAFPDGNYDESVKSICREVGLKYLLAENYLLPGEEDEPDILPRVSISGTTNYYSQILYINQQFRHLGF